MKHRWRVVYKRREGTENPFTEAQYVPIVLDTASGSETEFWSAQDANRAVLLLEALQAEHAPNSSSYYDMET
jgi:hypothetical protein